MSNKYDFNIKLEKADSYHLLIVNVLCGKSYLRNLFDGYEKRIRKYSRGVESFPKFDGW